MVCPNCGNVIPDNSVQCSFCGNRVASDQWGGQTQGQNGFSQHQSQGQGGFGQPQGQGGFGQPQGQGGFGQQPQGGYNMYNNQYYNRSVGNAPGFVPMLIIGIVYMICCCNILIAIPGLIFTFMMNSRYKEGNIVAFESNKKVAKWIYIIGIILWVISIILSAVTGILNFTFTTY